MPLTLELLELTEDELQAARQEVQRMAYQKWQAAGSPPGDPLRFWREAEREWIERYYVPDRYPSREDNQP